MSLFNPHNPATAGAEWWPGTTKVKVPSSTVGRGYRLLATLTETIAFVSAYMLPPVPLHGSPQMACDVYDLDAMPSGWPNDPVGKKTLAPASNSPATVSGWQKNVGGVVTAYDSTAWQKIDDAISDADPILTGTSDSLQYNIPTSGLSKISFGGAASFLDGASGAAAADLSTDRIDYVEVVALVTSGATKPVSVNGFVTLGGVDYLSTAQSLAFFEVKRLRWRFLVDPRDNMPWTRVTANTFKSAATNYFGVAVQGTPGTGAVLVDSLALFFGTVIERRTVTARGVMPSANGWVGVLCMDPADGTTPSAWAKVAGHTYLLVWSTSQHVGTPLAISGVDTSNVAGHETDDALYPGQDVIFTDSASGVPATLKPVDTFNMAAAVFTLSAASVDTQPYAIVRTDPVGGPDNLVAKQGITSEGAATYGRATVLVRTSATAGATDQNAPLLVKLRRASNDAVLATIAAGISPADVPADGKWHVVSIRFDASVALTAGLGVYLELSSLSTVPWYAAAVLTRGVDLPSSDAGALEVAAKGIGGITDKGTYAAVADSTLDYPWNIGTVPAAVTGLAASLATVPNLPTRTGQGAITTISYVHLAWTATSLADTFAYYEVSRLEPSDQQLHVIARITAESSPYFNDFEMLRSGVAALYGVRAVRTDGQASDSAPVIASVPAQPCGSYVFASNWSPALSVAYAYTTPSALTVAESPRTVVRAIAGRPRPVQFQANGDGQGDVFTATLLIATNDPSVAGQSRGVAVFDPLKARVREPVPYVAVTDENGRRWFAGLRLDRMVRTEPQGDYTADVTVTEVDTLPTPVEAAVPWHP
jgi:hypothetical protein